MRQERVWRVGLYIRLSREDGGNESLSVSNQRKILHEFLSGGGVGEYSLAGEFVDDGCTGTDDARPAFRRLLSGAKSGCVDCIVCKDLSRLFRNYADQGYYLESVFPRLGLRFVTVGNPRIDSFLQPETLQGLEAPITGIMNDRYAEKTSLEVRRTFDTKRRRGEFIGAFAPYGYCKDPRDHAALLPDEEAARTVRSIFAWFVLEGMSLSGIARRLDALGVANPARYKRERGLLYCNPSAGEHSRAWNATTVQRMLKNRVYRGDMVQGRQRVVSYKVHRQRQVPREDWFCAPNTHQPLVSETLFEAAQNLLAHRSRAPAGRKKPRALCGFLRCARCGRALHRSCPQKGRGYFLCRACKGHGLREDRAEEILRVVVLLQRAFAQDTTAAPADSDAATRRLRDLLCQQREERKRVQRIFDAATERRLTGEMESEQYERLKVEFAQRLERIERGMETICREMNEPAPSLRWETSDSSRRGATAALVKEMIWEENGGVSVRFSFENPF